MGVVSLQLPIDNMPDNGPPAAPAQPAQPTATPVPVTGGLPAGVHLRLGTSAFILQLE